MTYSTPHIGHTRHDERWEIDCQNHDLPGIFGLAVSIANHTTPFRSYLVTLKKSKLTNKISFYSFLLTLTDKYYPEGPNVENILNLAQNKKVFIYSWGIIYYPCGPILSLPAKISYSYSIYYVIPYNACSISFRSTPSSSIFLFLQVCWHKKYRLITIYSGTNFSSFLDFRHISSITAQ
jgi:hypothetical protein